MLVTRHLIFKSVIAIAVLIIMLWIFLSAQLLAYLQQHAQSQSVVYYSGYWQINRHQALTLKDLKRWLGQSDWSLTAVGAGIYRLNDDNNVVLGQLSFAGQTLKGLSKAGQQLNALSLPPLKLKQRQSQPQQGQHENLAAIPKSLVETLLLIEDKDFYQHYGVKLSAVIRAVWVNFQRRKLVQGGSTLTQQLVKNTFFSNERSLWRKIKEVIVSLALETVATKQQILTQYINNAYLGQSRSGGIYGFPAAAQFYFGQDLAGLSLDQTALLVAMVKGPSWYNPWRNPQRATQRRNLVLSELKRSGLYDHKDYLGLQSMPLGLRPRQAALNQLAGAYLDALQEQIPPQFTGEEALLSSKVVTTYLQPGIQNMMDYELKNSVNSLIKKYGNSLSNIQAAAVLVNASNGQVVALNGNKTAGKLGFNRATEAQRPIGSLFKPVVYDYALTQPNYHLATSLQDAPIFVNDKGQWRDQAQAGYQWAPKNFDKQSHGPIMLWQALANSYNQATVRLGLRLGLKDIVAHAQNLGIDKVPQYPSLLLGAVELTPMQVAQLYQHLLQQPRRLSLLAGVASESEQQWQWLWRSEETKVGQISAQQQLLRQSLALAFTEGTGKAYRKSLTAAVVGGKTGTTSKQRDSWYAGYIGDYILVVWLGFDDNRPMPLTGATGALPVWAGIAKNLAAAQQELQPKMHTLGFRDKGDLIQLWTEPDQLSHPDCPGAKQLPFLATGAQPTELSDCAKKQQGLWQRLKSWWRD